MGRIACRGWARGGRALWSMLLAVGGLVACGSERGDPALAASAATATATAAPVSGGQGECRRWTTCVPENPCHTGWVTGCRKNVPICTDIGGWLSNGTSCGRDAVCYMGECEACAAGQSCPIAGMYGSPDPCRAGQISCDTGQPVCKDVGPAPDGTTCSGGGPYVCKGGQCTWCMEGEACSPDGARCHVGAMTACATTGGTCVDTGALAPNGSWCGGDYPATSVCRDGECAECAVWAPCTPQAPCQESGYTDCSTGWPVCVPNLSKPDGTPCDGGGVCQGGACVPPCIPDQPCTPGYDGCYSGRTVCSSPTSGWCEAVAPVPDGTACGGGVCRAGSCTSCGAGSWCTSPDPCYGAGQVSCATALCEPAGSPYADGWSCGAGGETCQSAICTDDADPRLVVRSASRSVDLTGTSWARCLPDATGTGSTRVTNTFGVGTRTRVVETFATPDCTGDALARTSADGTASSAGDRYVSWSGGSPPPGVWTWSPTATAVHLTSVDPGGGTFDAKTLYWVNDYSTPRRLFTGDTSQVAADGYPLLLRPDTNPLTEVIPQCVPDQPCTPSYNACYSGRTVCYDAYNGYCQAQGDPLPDGTTCGNDLVCSSGSCLPCGPAVSCQSPDPCFATGARSCATGRCEPQPPPYGDGLTCGAGGETCQGGTCTPVPGADPWVRSTTAAVDLAGTTWAACMGDEPDPGMSRLRVDTYVAGGITHQEVVFTSSLDCTGPTDPARGFTIAGTLTSGGDRLASWARGYVPPGAPWSPTATAMHLTAADSPMGPIDFKELVFVDDAVSPRQLYTGESKNPEEGYPRQLEGSRPMTEVLACDAGAPCSPGFATCEVFAIDCSAGAPVCAGTGTFLADGAPCGAGLVCSSRACVPVPTRTVTGTSWMTYWPDGGAVATSDPIWVRSVAAVRFGGGFAYYPGTILPDGTFAIPNVPEGGYHLEYALPALRYVHTTSSTVDLGVDVLGRRDVAWPTGPTPVSFDVKGLVPWTRGDILEIASSNAGVAALPFGPQDAPSVPEGLVQLVGTFDWNGRPLVSGPAGDVAYVFQASTTTAPTGERVTAASGWTALPPAFEIADGLGGTVDVTLEACPASGSVSADWRRSEFEALAGMVHPDATPMSHRIVVGARPHALASAPGFRIGEFAGIPGLPLLVVQATPPAADGFVNVGYGRFLPPQWREYRHDRLMLGVGFLAPGATRTARLNAPIGYNVAADLAPAIVAPVVAPPTSLLINGVDAWTGISGAGAHPRLSWTAPAVSAAGAALFPGASLRYRVTVYELRAAPDGATQLVAVLEGKTIRTSYNVPASLTPGSTYVVAVEAALTTDSIDAPLRTSVENAFATVVSREFTP